MNNNTRWTCQFFTDLSTLELYQILLLRSRVFVVEQNCVYLDIDNKDQYSWHVCGWVDDVLVAYARLLPPGISYTEASIGRVVTNPDYRKGGYGKALMTHTIERTLWQFNVSEIRIGAQLYLLRFYESLHFKPVGEMYLEDGIPHIEMLLKKEPYIVQ